MHRDSTYSDEAVKIYNSLKYDQHDSLEPRELNIYIALFCRVDIYLSFFTGLDGHT